MRGRAAMVTATAAVLAALALPGAAGAGGFATVGLSSLPDGTAPGKPWHVTLTILQHGRTPLPGLSPEVRIRSADGKTGRTFAARPARRPGVYTADVVFPTAGQWRYAIADGFSQTHTFAPAVIGAADRTASAVRPAPVRESGANLGAAIGAAAVAGLLAALLADVLMRRRRPGPAPAAAR
jgi:hypothetical protein